MRPGNGRDKGSRRPLLSMYCTLPLQPQSGLCQVAALSTAGQSYCLVTSNDIPFDKLARRLEERGREIQHLEGEVKIVSPSVALVQERRISL
jgi:hypothetical protein